MNLDRFFNAKRVAIIGVSKNPNKVGHVIFRNLMDSKYQGEIFIVNPNEKEILGKHCYPSVLKIQEKIDMAVVAIPSEIILKVVEECGKKRIKNLVIITAGFEESGNTKLKEDLLKLLKKYKINVIGPNCVGIFDANTQLDTIFLPRSRLKRPELGGISFVCQSGAVGSAILDLATTEGYGFSKFISYGNAINVDESDIIDYLAKDKQTKVICLYTEGIKNGKKFIETAKKVSRKKPIIVVKGGITEEGKKATLSHTGSLAGSAEIYFAAFKQAKVIHAETLEDMFNCARVLEKCVKPQGNRIQVITNGGGYGIMSTDAIIKNNLKMAKMSSSTETLLKRNFPKIVTVANPIDLVGDATTERYRISLGACLKDKNIDILLVVLLYQTPLITPDVVDVVTEFNDLNKKPIIVVSTGGEFTQVLKNSLESNGVPCFTFPENAVKSIKKLTDYYL